MRRVGILGVCLTVALVAAPLTALPAAKAGITSSAPTSAALSFPVLPPVPHRSAAQAAALAALPGTHRVTLVLASPEGPAAATIIGELASQRLSQDRVTRLAQLAQRRAALIAASPTTAAAQAVFTFAAAHGLQVQSESATTVTLSGAPAALTALFGDPGAPTVQSGLAVPVELASDVTSVVGLSDAPAAYPHAIPLDSGAFTGPAITARYGGIPYANADGHGVRVGIFEATSPDSPATVSVSDFQTYTAAAGISTPLPIAGNDSRSGVAALGDGSGSGSVESMLDVEAVAAAAPQAQSVIYSGVNDDADELNTLADMADDAASGQLQVVTDSYGICEAEDSRRAMAQDGYEIERLLAAGATFLSASGDSGAYDCDVDPQDPNSPNTNALAVDFPSSDPLTLSVGGTTARQGQADTVWSGEPDPSQDYLGPGGGGGVSEVYSTPSYQLNYPGADQSGRNVPDVAAVADPDTGFEIYNSANGDESSGQVPAGWLDIAGTSLGSPLLAGWIADAISLSNISGRASSPGLGDLHAELYAHPEAFTDVTSGDNLYYFASAGYDDASGLGVPLLQRLIPLLAGAPFADPVITLPAFSRSPSVQVGIPALSDRHFTAFRLSVGPDSCATPPTLPAAAIPTSLSLPAGADTVTLVSEDILGGCHVSTATTFVDEVAPSLSLSLKQTPGTQTSVATVKASDSGSGLASVTVSIVDLDTGHVLRTLHNPGSYSFNSGGARFGLSGSATDLVGNTTGTITGKTTVDSGLDDRQLTRHGVWRSARAKGVLDGTESVSSKSGSYLMVSGYVVGSHAQRITVLTAEGKGKLAVYVDGKKYGAVSVGHHKALIVSRRIGVGRHTIRLVLVNGTVSVDGLVIS